MLKKNYQGMTEQELAALKNAQGGVCASCRQPETVKRNGKIRELCVDHDHIGGHVRGLLCLNCNKSLGHAKDSSAKLRALADYKDAIDHQIAETYKHQAGKCGGCSDAHPIEELIVDRGSDGRMRGLLCQQCIKVIRHTDAPETLRRLADLAQDVRDGKTSIVEIPASWARKAKAKLAASNVVPMKGTA
jgi:hypothetical protein